jgi:hypothetical protein
MSSRLGADLASAMSAIFQEVSDLVERVLFCMLTSLLLSGLYFCRKWVILMNGLDLILIPLPSCHSFFRECVIWLYELLIRTDPIVATFCFYSGCVIQLSPQPGADPLYRDFFPQKVRVGLNEFNWMLTVRLPLPSFTAST